MYILASRASLRSSRVRLPAVPGAAARGGAARGRGAAGGFGVRVPGRSFGACARGARCGALRALRRPTRRDAFGRLLFRRLRVLRGFRVGAGGTAAAAERRPVRRRVVSLFRPFRVGARGGVGEGAFAAVEALDRGMRPHRPSRTTRRERVLFFFRRRLFFRARVQAHDRRAPCRRGVFGSVFGIVFGIADADRRGADAVDPTGRVRSVPRGRAARRGFILLRGGQTADGGGRRRRRRRRDRGGRRR